MIWLRMISKHTKEYKFMIFLFTLHIQAFQHILYIYLLVTISRMIKETHLWHSSTFFIIHVYSQKILITLHEFPLKRSKYPKNRLHLEAF